MVRGNPKTGYPEIERLIDTEDFNDVNAIFAGAHQQLAKLATTKGGFKKSREAKKGMKAIELVMNLFRELLTLKYQMKERLAQKAGTKPGKQ